MDEDSWFLPYPTILNPSSSQSSSSSASGFFERDCRRFRHGLIVYSYHSPSSNYYSFHSFCLFVLQEYHLLLGSNDVINVVFKYENILGHYNHLSIKRSDLELHGLEWILRRILMHEGDVMLYHGSDYINSLVSEEYEYYLSPSYFAFVCKPKSGGMILSFCSFRYCDVLDVSKSNDNCFFECLAFIDVRYSCFDISRFRSNYCNPHVIGIPLSSLPAFEKLAGVSLCVVEDDIDVSDTGSSLTISPKVLYGSLSSPVILLLKSGHYYVFSRLKPNGELIALMEEERDGITKDPSNSGKRQYSFFDYETFFDPHSSCVIPYALSVKDDRGTSVVFSVNPEEEQEFMDSACRKMIYGFDENNSNRYIVGYNNSSFDNFMLLRSSMRSNCEIGRVLVDSCNRILYMRIGKCNIFDLYRFLLTPLSRACKSFGCTTLKRSMDHLAVQESAFMGKERLTGYLEGNFADIVSYSKGDVESLSELFLIVRSEFYNLLGVHIEDYRTISSMSYKCFVASLPKEIVLPIASEALDSIIRRSVVGGRAQMFRGLAVCASTASLDFVSLYPFVMMHREYPLGTEEPISTRTYRPGFLGLYEVRIVSQPELKIIPKRDEDGSLDWSYKGEIEAWITSVDYECLIRHGSKVLVKHGIVWKHKTRALFSGFMKGIMEEKKTQDLYKRSGDKRYNSSYRECLKLVLNSLSGKMLERVWRRRKLLVKTQLDIKRAEKRIEIDAYTPLQENQEYLIAEGELKNPKIKSPSIVGSLIYSYAREWVYENALMKSKTKYGTDTDSLFLDYQEMVEIKEKNPEVFGTNEGQMVNEYDFPFSSIFISPKCYIYYRELDGGYGEDYEHHKDGVYEILKPRWKGVKRYDRVVKDEKLSQLIAGGMVNSEMLHSLYHRGKLSHALSVATYKSMVDNPKKEVLILSNKMEKRVGDSEGNISIKDRYLMKRFLPEKDEITNV
eukprot:TRINITY_DN64_c0_g1_i1.p1 TRINITY_DN64_c0_g1~~TRINITY_DN64_c0_g1_i1.p1  ORF type:complete len:956 (+),score=28.80 TRINITY_DN64_c0_g1_i1:398-3265(+)